MKYCTQCGNPCEDSGTFCSNCGAKLNEQPQQSAYQQPYQQHYQQPAVPMKASDGKFIYGLIGFFFPLIGFILWLLLKGDREGDAKRAGRGAIIGIITGFIVSIVSVILLAFIGVGVMEESGILENFGEYLPMFAHLM